MELELRKKLGVIHKDTLIVAVPDPASVRIGSGGATLNALHVVSERLSAMQGYNYINYDAVKKSRILILHSGGDSQRLPICSVRGKAFCSLPSTSGFSRRFDFASYLPSHPHACCIPRNISSTVVSSLSRG